MQTNLLVNIARQVSGTGRRSSRGDSLFVTMEKKGGRKPNADAFDVDDADDVDGDHGDLYIGHFLAKVCSVWHY